MKSLKVSKYFELVKPTYTYIKITPDKSIRNYNSSNVAKAIAHTYKSIDRRIRREQKKIFFETDFKIAYIVDIYSSNANFYFMIPKPFASVIVEKIKEIWPRATIEEVEIIKEHSKEALCYQLTYKKEDALSLQVDKKSNEPLNSILSVIDIMKEDDRVTIIYNFLPRNQFGWLKQYHDTMDKIKEHKPIDREKVTPAYIAKVALTTVMSILDSIVEVMNDFLGNKQKQKHISLLEAVATVLEQDKELSAATKKKREQTIIDTQIVVLSEGKDRTRQENNILSVCQSYRVLDEDNELTYKRVKKEFILEDYRFKNIDINTISSDEAQNFIQIPGRSLLRQFNLKHVKTTENPVPKEIQSGYISLGSVKFKGEKQGSYIEDDYDKGSLPLVEIGAQGAGKSTFMANYYRFANTRKEGGVLIDFIKNCEMSEEVIRYLPKDDMIVLDYTKEECMQGFSFNEFKVGPEMGTFEKLNLTNLQAQQILTFVDSINQEQTLQARMRKYLSSAANVVFATGENSLKEVVNCLEDNIARADYIAKLSPEEKEFLMEEIKALSELDEYSKVTKDNPIATVIGTRNDRVDGILDRISLLREDFKLKYMFNKGSKGNIDFAEELENGKVIIIRMPQDSFKKHAKNVIVTFLLSKIWVATELRGKLNKKPKPTHISIDEIFQCKTAMKMLANDEILPQTRKFGCKFIFSCQYTEQIEILIDTLIGAGASFMLMTGTSEKDFKLFESKLEGFEYEDLRDMEQYSSLNLIYYSGGYASFISKLPPPIKMEP